MEYSKLSKILKIFLNKTKIICLCETELYFCKK